MAAALNDAAKNNQKSAEATVILTQSETKKNTKATRTPAVRIGKKAVTGWFDSDVVKQLKMIGIERDMSIQDMIGEALNDFFTKHRKAQIAK